jgi:hypothetical protein
MIGSQRTSTKEGRRLTTAGLIAVTTAATPLMMAVPEFATRLREAARSAA